MINDDFDYITPDYDNEYEEPDTWTIISVLDRVLSVVLEESLYLYKACQYQYFAIPLYHNFNHQNNK